jgi:hypothetical protein
MSPSTLEVALRTSMGCCGEDEVGEASIVYSWGSLPSNVSWRGKGTAGEEGEEGTGRWENSQLKQA